MAKVCQHFAILGFDTRRECLSAITSTPTSESTTSAGATPSAIEQAKKVKIGLNPGQISGIVIGVILVLIAAIAVYFTGRSVLRAVQRLVSACHRAATNIRKHLARTQVSNETMKDIFAGKKKTKSRSPKSNAETKVEIETEIQTPGKSKKKTPAPKPPKVKSTPKNAIQMFATANQEIDDSTDNRVRFLIL